MSDILAIIILGVLVIAQAVERYLYTKEMNKQLQKAQMAVMSRNINEYLTATNEPKKDTAFVENEDIDLAEATEEEFMNAINKPLE